MGADDSWMLRFSDWWLADPSLFRLPYHFWTGVFFVLGSFMGSFLNVCIHRLPLGQSVVHPPSHCPKCGYRIPLILNIPLFTWLWLRGRCANCRDTISSRYFFVELLTSVTFGITWLVFGREQPGLAGAFCILLSLFIAATFIDIEHLIIPDEITLGGAGLGLILSTFIPELQRAAGAGMGFLGSLLGLAVGMTVVMAVVQFGKLVFGREKLKFPEAQRLVLHEEGLWLPDKGNLPFEDIFFRATDTLRFHGKKVELADRCYPAADIALSPRELTVGTDTFEPNAEPYLAATAQQLVLPREAMGLGDVKFMATIGAFLGWKATFFSLGMASFLGAMVGVSLIAAGRREWSSRIPFGPYLAVGAILWMFGGHVWWDQLFQP
jgi:leader peptidase (prepilin peptidase)/N-methyltransferase